MPRILIRLIIVALQLPIWCAAVQPFTPMVADPILEPWRWRHEEALRQVGAVCMDEAPDGALWFGGTGCVASYDGQRVERIPFDDQLLAMITHQKDNPWAKALLVLEDNSLLVLVGESLVRWRDGDWHVVVQDVGYSEFSARLQRADDGVFWLLVHDSLWRVPADLSGGTRVMQVAEDGQELGAFCIDTQGDVWVVRRQSDANGQLVHIPLVNGFPQPELEWREIPIPYENDMTGVSLLAGDDGLIWYADNSRKSGLVSYDPDLNRWGQVPYEKLPPGIYSLIKGRDGTIWGGTEGGLLTHGPDGNGRSYPRGSLGLPLVPVTLFETRGNRLWLLGRIGYVYSVDLGTREWMTLAQLHFQCETPDGKQWFIRNNTEVVSHDPATRQWLEYGADDKLISDMNSLFASSHGLVWASGSHAGGAAIAVFDGRRWTRFLHPKVARWIEPNAVFEAADGTMWFGCGGRKFAETPNAGGALQYTVDENGRPKLREHHAPPEFPYYVTSIAQTPDQALWIGSTLAYRKGVEDETPKPMRGLGGENSVSMAVDDGGTLWLAKEHYGVSRWRDGEWEVFDTQDGIASQLLSGLLVLRDGSLLVSSEMGISRFDGKSWTTRAYPERFGMAKRWSGMRLAADGSLWLNYSDDELRSPLIFQEGKRYGTLRHVPERDPPDTRIVEYLPRVSQPGNTHIRWSARDPWGETPKDLMRFSWRLDGGEWSAFTAETSHTFLDLDHGRHVLEVRARDRAFNVDPSPDRVEFTVIAPIGLQPWFIGMVALMLCAIALLIWMWIYFHDKRLKDRQRHLVEMDRLKTSFFTNLSHELRTPLTVMLSPLQSLLRSETDAAKTAKLSMVIRSAERVTTLVTQLLDFRKLEQGKMEIELAAGDIVKPVRSAIELLRPLAQARGVVCRFESQTKQLGLMDEDKLRKITSNLVGNAVKYTRPGGEVFARLEFTSGAAGLEKLTLVVEDSGAGIEPEHLEHIFDRFFRGSEKTAVDGSGIGLNFTKELVELLGGTIRAESPIHQDAERPGTRFVVELPIGNDAGVKNSAAEG